MAENTNHSAVFTDFDSFLFHQGTHGFQIRNV